MTARFLPVLFTLLLTGFSCINVTINGTDVPVDDFVNEANETVEEMEPVTEAKTYENMYGYGFEYDPELVVWSELDVQNEVAVPSDGTEALVTVSHVSPLLFQGEVNTLTFEIIATEQTPTEWSLENTSGDDRMIDAETEALDVYGAGTIDQPFRTHIVDLGSELLVVRQGMEDLLFDAVIASLVVNE